MLATFKEFQAGKILPETFLAWSPRVLEAELALRDEDADPAPLYERNWRVACEAERIAEVKIQAGKIDVADAAEARCGASRRNGTGSRTEVTEARNRLSSS